MWASGGFKYSTEKTNFRRNFVMNLFILLSPRCLICIINFAPKGHEVMLSLCRFQSYEVSDGWEMALGQKEKMRWDAQTWFLIGDGIRVEEKPGCPPIENLPYTWSKDASALWALPLLPVWLPTHGKNTQAKGLCPFGLQIPFQTTFWVPGIQCFSSQAFPSSSPGQEKAFCPSWSSTW